MRRRGRVLALLVRLDRHAEGRAARAFEPDGDREALRAGRDRHHARTTSCFSAGKLFFAYGLGNGMSFPMSVGATAVLLPERPTPEAVFEVLQARAADHVLRRADALRRDAGRSGLHAGERLRSGCACASRPAKRCPSISAPNGRSASASTSSTASARPRCCTSSCRNQPGKLRYGTSGMPVPGYELRLVDEQGARGRRRRDRRTAGARHRRAAEGYWNQREKSAPHLRGRVDAHRRQVRARRGRHTIATAAAPTTCSRSSGIWVSPFEVESALISHPRVLEAAVVPKEDADGLLKPKAFIVLKDGAKRQRAAARGAARST